MTKKQILITGTDGFVGSNIKEHFFKEGYEVYGTTFYRDPEDEKEIRMDFSQPEEFNKLWDDKEFSIIIHTVGIVDTTGKVPDELFDAVHVEGTRNIVEYAKKRGCEHFIFTSSIATYGMKGMSENITESNTEIQLKKNPSAYGRTKVIAEMLIEESGLNYSILRLPIIQGKNDTFITDAIIPMLEDKKPFTCGKKEKKVSLMYIKNFGPMLSKLIEVGPLNTNLNCSSHHLTWNELVTEYAINLGVEYIPKKKNFYWIYLTRNRRRPGDTLVAAYSKMGAHIKVDKLYSRLEDWKPTHSWKEGVREATETYLKKKENAI